MRYSNTIHTKPIKNYHMLVLGLILLGHSARAEAQMVVDLTQSDQEIAEELAPVIYFHPDEQYFPATYEWYTARSVLKDGNGYVIDSSLSGITELVSRFTDDDNYLDLNDSYRGGNLGVARLYAQVQWNEPFVDVVFWAFYPFNGCQIFRGKFYDSLAELLINSGGKTRNFEWCDFGRHEHDTEYMIIRMLSNGAILQVGFSAHGDVNWHGISELDWTDTKRVNAYVAFNTHGFYPDKSVVTTGTILSDWYEVAALSVTGVYTSYLKTVDTTSTSDLVGYDGTSYTAWDTQSDVIIWNPDWLANDYTGRWGAVLDNTSIQDPTGDVPNVKDALLQALGVAAEELGLLDDYTEGNNATGAWLRSWFQVQ
jgi:hypothetical protein